MSYTLYILETLKGTYYTGITTNLDRRLLEHRGKNNRGAKYTKAFPVKKVVYVEILENRSLASQRESQIKKLKRSQKTLLINSQKSNQF